MVRRRVKPAPITASTPSDDEVERFAAGAEAAISESAPLDPALKSRVERLISSASGVSEKLTEELTELFLEELTRASEGGASRDELIEHINAVDPSASRDFKAINLPLNRYEYELISSLARRRGVSKSNVIRAAIRAATQRE